MGLPLPLYSYYISIFLFYMFNLLPVSSSYFDVHGTSILLSHN